MKRQKERIVFSGEIFKVTVQQITSDFRFERVYQRDGVCVFPISKEGYVRLIRTSDPDGGNRRTAPVSGVIADDDISPLACAKRELREELKLKGTRWKLLATVKGGGGFVKSQYFFVVWELTEVQRTGSDPNERIYGFVDLPYEKVLELVWRDRFPADISFAFLKLILGA